MNETPSEATSGYDALQCNPRSSGCPGSNNNYCEPNVVWSGELKSGTNYYYGNLNSGTFYASTGNNANYTNAYGVRCVLDLDFIKQKENYRQLCDANSGYGALRCYWYDGCPGANNSRCYPYNVWSGTASGSNYVNHNLNNGTFNGPYNNVSTNAFSVRCVLDLNILKYKIETLYIFAKRTGHRVLLV